MTEHPAHRIASTPAAHRPHDATQKPGAEGARRGSPRR